MTKNIVYALAVLISAVAISGGAIMAQQYQSKASDNSPAPVISQPACPCGQGCDCTANGQPCSCGQKGETCSCGAGGGAGKCHQSP